jgi:hypothetical protein
MFRSILATLPVLALLAACGGAATIPPPPPRPPPPPPGPTVERSSVELDRTSFIQFADHLSSPDKISLGLITIPAGLTTVNLDRNPFVVRNLPDGFAIYTSTGNRQKAVRAVTPSGDGTALSVLLLSGGTLWRGHQRLRDTVLPTGSATYTGDYLGTLIRRSDNSPASVYAPQNDEYILGKVELRANFETARISGTVTGRASNVGRSFEVTSVKLV